MCKKDGLLCSRVFVRTASVGLKEKENNHKKPYWLHIKLLYFYMDLKGTKYEKERYNTIPLWKCTRKVCVISANWSFCGTLLPREAGNTTKRKVLKGDE